MPAMGGMPSYTPQIMAPAMPSYTPPIMSAPTTYGSTFGPPDGRSTEVHSGLRAFS